MTRRAAAWVLALAGGAAAQDPRPDPEVVAGYHYDRLRSGLELARFPVPDATHAAIALTLPLGADHDPAGRTGLAQVAARLLDLCQLPRPERERWYVQVLGRVTLLGAVCEGAQLRERLDELARFLAGEVPLGDDLVARARAAARARADELHNYSPGAVLVETVRRDLFAGQPSGRQRFGIAAEIAAVERGELERWFAAAVQPGRVRVALLGAVPQDAVDQSLAALPAPASEPPPLPPPAVHDSLGEVAREVVHPRVLGPFVTMAVRGPEPGAPDWLAFQVAARVLEQRAYQRLQGYRGGEVEASFPPFWMQPTDGFALVNRRGRDGNDVALPQGEIKEMVHYLRGLPPGQLELRAAIETVAHQFMLPPYEGQLERMAASPALLAHHAEVLALAPAYGWSPTLQLDLGQLPVRDVLLALGRYLADERLHFYALLPPDR